MPVNLNLLSHAAPLIVEAANAIFSRIRKNKERSIKDQVFSQDEKITEIDQRLTELFAINEEQSVVIKNLAEQNQKLIIALRNVRIVAIGALAISIISVAFIFLL
jgi:hypothetical protein